MKAFQLKSITAIFILFIGMLLLNACKKDEKSKSSNNPVVNAIDPGSGKGGDVLALTGSGLGDITSIVFDKDNVPAGFNPNFNTNTAVIFRVPDTASGGTQNIIFTNRSGAQVKVPFTVNALPLVSAVSNYNFTAGTLITLTGINLEGVSSVTLAGGTTAVEVISKAKKELVVKMPVTAVNSAKLIITNPSGVLTTTQEFVNMDKVYKIFTDGYNNGFVNASWGPADISTTVFKSGTSSFMATYGKGNWSADGFANWDGIPNMPEYTYLSFWVKGGSADYTLFVTGDQRAGGYGNSDDSTPFTVPANVWTYIKIPMSKLELWKKGGAMKQLGFFIKGPDKQDETFYFDDMIFVK